MNSLKIKESSDRQSECGASMVEYALLIALIAIVVIAAMTQFQIAVNEQYSLVETKI